MDIVPAATEAFELPEGWVVELRPRFNSSHTPDKYYHEPHTGRVFRSLPSVKRYLNGEVEPARRRKAPKTHHLGTQEEFEGRKENAGRMGVNHKALSTLPDGWIVEKVPMEAFELPDGWVIELKPRINSSHAPDRYYHEPHTGRQFRSLTSVKRYLNGEVKPTPKRMAPNTRHEAAMKFGTRRRIVRHGKLWTPQEFEVAGRKEDAELRSVNHKALSILPDGWIVEEVPRRCGIQIDTYYIEPTSGRRFRSIPEVQRYLTADDEFAAKYKPLQMINSTEPKMSAAQQPGIVKPQKSISDLLSEPPERITWTLTASASSNSPEKWVAFWESFLIPDNVRHLWEATFLFGMTAGQVNYTDWVDT